MRNMKTSNPSIAALGMFAALAATKSGHVTEPRVIAEASTGGGRSFDE